MIHVKVGQQSRFGQARKRNPNPNFLVRISSAGVGVFHVKGWGPKSSVCPSDSFETQGYQTFWRDIPGFCRDIPGAPEKFEKKMFVFNSRPLFGPQKITTPQDPSNPFRRGSIIAITPFKTHRADFKIEEDRGKIEERSRKIKEDIFGFFFIFWQIACADGLRFWGQVSPVGAYPPPPHPPP